jgi:transposase
MIGIRSKKSGKIMGRRLQIEWQEEAEELKKSYRQESHPQRRERLFVLWHLRAGKHVKEVSEITGVGCRIIQRWLAWYRVGGLSEVLHRVLGHGSQGKPSYLSQDQQKALVARVLLGDFATVWEVMEWVKARWGIIYSYEGMRSLMKRHDLGLKVPRPRSDKADTKAQEAWQKKGF